VRITGASEAGSIGPDVREQIVDEPVSRPTAPVDGPAVLLVSPTSSQWQNSNRTGFRCVLSHG
jgi:hypothetical protein